MATEERCGAENPNDSMGHIHNCVLFLPHGAWHRNVSGDRWNEDGEYKPKEPSDA